MWLSPWFKRARACEGVPITDQCHGPRDDIQRLTPIGNQRLFGSRHFQQHTIDFYKRANACPKKLKSLKVRHLQNPLIAVERQSQAVRRTKLPTQCPQDSSQAEQRQDGHGGEDPVRWSAEMDALTTGCRRLFSIATMALFASQMRCRFPAFHSSTMTCAHFHLISE
jgi:hypothetical protein